MTPIQKSKTHTPFIGPLKSSLKNIDKDNLKKSLKKKKFVFGTVNSKYIYKVAWQESSIILKNEFKAAKQNKTSEMWHDLGHYMKPLLQVNFFTVARASKLIQIDINNAIVLELTELLYDRAYKYRPDLWWKTLDQSSFELVWDSLNSTEKFLYKKYLNDMVLPVTSAHGDLVHMNILFDEDNKIRVVDWEYYRPYGSVLTDLLRLHFWYFRQELGSNLKKKMSPFDVDMIMEHRIFEKLSRYLQLDEKKLCLLAGVANASMPVLNLSPIQRAARLSTGLNGVIKKL